jgi:hypothetical protein
MAEESAAGYMCLATMDVPTDQADLYDQLLCEAASIFKTHDWRLLVSAQKAAQYDVIGTPPGLVRKLLHLWSIPSFDSLPQVMAYAADNPSYVKAQALTIDEMQNLYVALRWNDPIDLPDTPVAFYMMETLQMADSVGARESFANYMGNAVYQMNTSYGWKILFAGNAATGIIDQYVNIWGMADSTKLEAAITAYRGAASWSAAVVRVSTSMWTPRPLTCFDEPGPEGTTGGVKAG